jgi:membrane-associated protein
MPGRSDAGRRRERSYACSARSTTVLQGNRLQLRTAVVSGRRSRRRLPRARGPFARASVVSAALHRLSPLGQTRSLFHHFTEVVADASGWAYAIVCLFTFLDALLPVVPSETAVITAGVVASAGDLSLALVIPAAAFGAFLGDNSAYLIGRRFGNRMTARFSGAKSRRRIDWAQDQLRERGGELIAVGRFIPGGRTAVTVSAGMLRFPWRRFLLFDAAATLGWALYASLLGYVGGRAFETAWKGLLVALGIAFAVAGGVELVRWAFKRTTGP